MLGERAANGCCVAATLTVVCFSHSVQLHCLHSCLFCRFSCSHIYIYIIYLVIHRFCSTCYTTGIVEFFKIWQFTENEVVKAVYRLKSGKAAGVDQIQPELLKYSTAVLPVLTKCVMTYGKIKCPI